MLRIDLKLNFVKIFIYNYFYKTINYENEIEFLIYAKKRQIYLGGWCLSLLIAVRISFLIYDRILYQKSLFHTKKS
jgi:hypothetical protein